MMYLIDKKYFGLIYSAILCLISFVFWIINGIVGIALLSSVAIFFLLYTKKIKYVIPCLINMIFVNRAIFSIYC